MRTMPLHGHTFFELLLFTGGSGIHQVGGCHHAIRERTAFVIAPGVTHDAQSLGDAEGWVVLFLPDSVSESSEPGLSLQDDIPTGLLFDLFRQPVLQMTRPVMLDAATHCQNLSLLTRMERELANKPLGYEFAVRSALQLILVNLARCAPWLSLADIDRTRPSRSRDLISLVFRDIDQHFRDPGGLDRASKRLGFNGAYLTTRVRKLTGKTYGEWMIERKMIEARRLLANTDRSVAGVATDLGYAEIESFVGRFRQHHGITPAAWRRATASHSPAR